MKDSTREALWLIGLILAASAMMTGFIGALVMIEKLVK